MVGRNKIILLSLIIMITLFISGCGEEKKCANQIQSFVSACNELDTEGILSCMDPSIADPIRITFGVIGTLTGKELNDVLDGIIHILIKGLQLFNDEIEMEQIFSSMSIEVEKIKIEEEYAQIEGKISFHLFGKLVKRDVMVDMKETDQVWYIMKISLES